VSQLLNMHLVGQVQSLEFDRTSSSDFNDDSQKIQIQDSVFSDEIEIPTSMVILNRVRKRLGTNGSQFIVQFELIDRKTKASIQIVSKQLNVSEHIQQFQLPVKAPDVNITSSSSSRVNLEVKQIDRNSSLIDVYKKVINVINVDNDEYKHVKTLTVNPDQFIKFPVDKPLTSTILYRFIPRGKNDRLGSSYTNIILKTDRAVQDKSLSLVTRLVETGIEIEASSFPPGLVSIEFLGRNLSTFEKSYRNIGTDNFSITESIRTLDSVSVIDTLTLNGDVYEYVARMHFKSGIPEYSQSSVIEKIEFKRDELDIIVSQLSVVNDLNNPNVTFTINVRLVDNDSDITRKLLERSGLKNLFENELLNERDLIKDLVSFNVQRINLTTGERENFGTLTNNIFNDANLQKNNSVKPLKFDQKYQYEVYAMLRSAETLFETLLKTKVDPTTGKSYQFKPSNKYHPLALIEGIVTTSQGLKTKPKNAFEYGRLGMYEVVNVSFDENTVEISNVKASRFDNERNVISWDVNGSINKIDHFLIMKDVHGVRTMIGKSHANSKFQTIQHFHFLNEHDRGEFKYVIVFVRNNYTISSEFVSNSIEVE